MRLQYRIFWKKHKNSEELLAKSSLKNKPKGKALLFSLFSMAILGVSVDAYSENNQQKNVAVYQKEGRTYKVSLSPSKLSKAIILKADKQGHFRGHLLINNVSMPFLIDTGATKIVIPENLATSANLTLGEEIITETAGGQVLSYKTKIDVLNIGGVVMNDINAHTNQHIKEVLIGMNTLKYFQITLNDQELTLVANSDNLYYESAQTAKRRITKKTVIKKTVTCDEQGDCLMSYSN